MKPLAYTLPYAWLFWAVFLFAYVPEFGLVTRSRPAKGEKADRGSMIVIMLAGSIGNTRSHSRRGDSKRSLSRADGWLGF